jgi:hypothetical protein
MRRTLSIDYLALKQSLTINCKDCSGLCCVALFFNKNDGFPYHKKAGDPCLNLDIDNTCKIYEQLDTLKLKGCKAYDCFGAGQKVTLDYQLLGDWRTNEQMKLSIFTSFDTNRMYNQILWYLLEAITLCDESNIEQFNLLIKENIEITHKQQLDLMINNLDDYRKRVNAALKLLTNQVANQSKHKIDNKLQFEKDYSKQNLDYVDLTMSYLIGSNLEGCSLHDTNFLGADLRDVSIKNTDLSHSIFLTQFQVNTMIGNKKTILPNGLISPIHWSYYD